jgi:signal transduction histidine kinase/DNA-binding response OmpR family regulator
VTEDNVLTAKREVALDGAARERLRAIMARERELNALSRMLADARQWAEATAGVVSELYASSDVAVAREMLVQRLPSAFRFDGAVLTCSSFTLASGVLPGRPGKTELAQLLRDAEQLKPGAAQLVRPATPTHSVAVFAVRLSTATANGAAPLVLLFQSEKLARYYPVDPSVVVERLSRMALAVGQAFDNVVAQEQVRLQRDDLQRTVETATSDFRHALAKAEDAGRAAENSARVRGQFLANMSHEIRTPLNAVLGYTELLLRGMLAPEEQQRSLRAIDQSGRHLLQLLDDVLDLARIESGGLQVDLQPTDLPEILFEVCSLLRARAVAKGVELTLEFASRIPTRVVSDGGRVRQVLLNLIGNAVKFTDKGSIVVIVDFTEGEPEGMLRVNVQDTGVGLSQGDITRVFKAFEQANSSTSRSHGGTGLGLPISRQLAQMLGGDISLESTLGAGSTFAMYISAAVASDSMWVERPEVVVGATSTAALPRLRGRVLVADDTPVNRDLFRAILTGFGLTVVEVNDGAGAAEAIATAERAGLPFAAVLMDMQMPVMDGYEATRKLRAEGMVTPIIAVTAHAMAGDRVECLNAGCTEYLSKPVRAAALHATLARFVRRDRTRLAPSVHSTTDLVLSELMDEFKRELASSIEVLRAAVASGDLKGVSETSHRIKGTTATFGYATLSAVAGQLEVAARRNVPVDVESLFEQLQRELAREHGIVSPLPTRKRRPSLNM